MPAKKQTEDQQPSDSDQEKAAEAGNQQVEEQVEQRNEQGFSGVEVDQTPNENYTVKGVTSNPEGVPEAQPDPTVARREAASS
jgi:hypothetical protein